jgi:hypothetical protein
MMTSVESLAQLEVDLASPEMVRLRSLRPTGDLSSHIIAQLDKKVKEKSKGKFKYLELAGKLVSARSVRDLGTEPKELEGVPWPLSVRSMHHWSSKTLKNPKRDLPKHAIMAFVEELAVSEYRPKLLHESAAACHLRTSLHRILDVGLKKIKGSRQPQGRGRIKWTYHDTLDWDHKKSFTPSRSDARKLLLDHSHLVVEKERGQQVVGLLNRILKHEVALVKPGDQAYGDVVAPEVADCVCNLLNVSGESCLVRNELIHII